ncbi:MAG TPA: hypothetical protein VIH42_03455 [Thermoguttaceae bacterium]
MPDRKKGFVRRKKGILPPDKQMANIYKKQAKQSKILFSVVVQKLLLEEFSLVCRMQRLRAHYISTEPTHVHVLVSWDDDRSWFVIRNGIKTSFSRRLNKEESQRTWFSSGASRKRVKDQAHFDYLITQYLPSHLGWQWQEGKIPFR